MLKTHRSRDLFMAFPMAFLLVTGVVLMLCGHFWHGVLVNGLVQLWRPFLPRIQAWTHAGIGGNPLLR